MALSPSSDVEFENASRILKELKFTLQCISCNRISDTIINNTTCRHTLCSSCARNNQCPCCESILIDIDLTPSFLLNGVVRALKDTVNQLNPVDKMRTNTMKSTPKKAVRNQGVKLLNTTDSKTKTDARAENISKSPALKCGGKDYKKNSKGETPLHVACKKDDIATVKRFLESNTNPNTKDYAGWTPLHEAVFNRNLSIVESLLKAGALVNVPGLDQVTPLHAAAENGYADIVKLLLKFGAEKSMRDCNGNTPLKHANREILDIFTTYNTVNNVESISYKIPDFKSTLVYILNEVDSDIKKQFLNRFEKSNDIKIISKIVKDVTHVVVPSNEKNVCLRTSDVHKSILLGSAIVNSDWLTDCLKNGTIVDFTDYEVNGTIEHPVEDGPKKARLNFMKLLPPLFEGCKIYIHPAFSATIEKNTAVDLVKYSGASLLVRAPNPEYVETGKYLFHCKSGSGMEQTTTIILYQEGHKEPVMKYNMAHIKTLPFSWFIDCIETFSIIDFTG